MPPLVKMRLTDLPIAYPAHQSPTSLKICAHIIESHLIFDQNFDHINISEQFSSHQLLLSQVLLCKEVTKAQLDGAPLTKT